MPTIREVNKLLDEYMEAHGPGATRDDFIKFLSDYGHFIDTRAKRDELGRDFETTTAELTLALILAYQTAPPNSDDEHLAKAKMHMFRAFIHSHGGDDDEMELNYEPDEELGDPAAPARPPSPGDRSEDPSGGRKKHPRRKTRKNKKRTKKTRTR